MKGSEKTTILILHSNLICYGGVILNSDLKMKEILDTYLNKSGTFVTLTLQIFFGIPAMIIIPLFVENYNLMVTLEVFIFSVWFGTLFYRHQLLKNNE